MKSNCINTRCLALWRHVAFDTTLVSYVTERDYSYLAERVQREGMEFLTVTLPRLGKALERAFKTGQLERVEGFAVVKGSIRPQFLNRAWSVLFSREGVLNWSPSPTYRVVQRDECGLACQVVRQLTLMFYKTKLPYSDRHRALVEESFLKTEWDLLVHAETKRSECLANPILDRARFVVHVVLGRLNYNSLQPSHGSGASACKTKPWERYSAPRYSSKLAKVFPYDEWFVSGLNGLEDADWLREEPVDDHLPARVALVPKDSRGPRLISTEPREHMYIQQALMSAMYARFQHYPNVKRGLDCTDQTRNRRLAAIGSDWQTHATIDLKDASDRVAYWLVEALFPPDWWEALDACRTASTILPSGQEVYLCKFAPMGSACCFPVEALVFYALAIATVYPSKDRLYNSLFKRAEEVPTLESVSVFGDDIIVPTQHFQNVCNTLEEFGLIVNQTKSYSTGPFRESCGADYYDGYDVSIVRVGHLPYSVGSRTVINHAKFRTRDFLNQVALKYGIWDSNKGAELFTELYQAPVVRPPATFREVCGECMIGDSLIILGASVTVPSSYKTRVREGKTQVLVGQERSVNCEIDTGDWSHVLRVFLKGSRDRVLNGLDTQHAGMVSPARRLRYKYGWVDL